MEFPIQWTIFGVHVPLHLLFEVLAFSLGYRYYSYLRKYQTDPLSNSQRILIIIGAALGALIGSRVLGAMERPLDWWTAADFWLYLYKNKTVVGGFVGGLIGVELMKKAYGIRQSSGDLFVFPIILALMIGRLGCFSMGVGEETYGMASNLPWAMDLGDGIRRHPVVLYELIFLALLWICLNWISRRWSLQSGKLFQFFMIAYVVYRFLQEFIKPVWTYDIIGLSSIQWVCLAVLAYYHKTILSLFIAPHQLLHDQK
ncbi:prolipoprotein diacylglyceryl transferase [Nonlabens xiamenensis]|uniref:prolipoprotein diacylglyceryl transferase n=1 Tax=Nonlabens xiamenensis TaxID=2341043 RepID=UPI000F60B37A|nr:prolipoprotein diacylglyceryl transferase family protein [Nonlabens xiamenensis]